MRPAGARTTLQVVRDYRISGAIAIRSACRGLAADRSISLRDDQNEMLAAPVDPRIDRIMREVTDARGGECLPALRGFSMNHVHAGHAVGSSRAGDSILIPARTTSAALRCVEVCRHPTRSCAALITIDCMSHVAP
ncbi:MAG: hypothetical protein M3Q46_01635 [Verrucomicrobiota bacterium]|nr:hypothetical protein [Verrucomicrobiota bacterium]